MNKSKTSDISNLIRMVFGKKIPRHFTSAVIVAAGSSERMGGDTPKQFINICGAPVVVRTLLAYEKCDSIHEIVIVCREGDAQRYEEFREKYGITKLGAIVVGAETRQISVVKGLEAVSDKTEFVAIADAARCLTTPEMISEVCRQAYRYDAATAATKAVDSIKRVKKGFVEESIPRNEVWLAQTPQVFRINLYRAAAYNAIENGRKATDDNELVEAIGRTVMVVECGKDNFKLTSPEDLYLAEAIIKMRTDAEEKKKPEGISGDKAVDTYGDELPKEPADRKGD